MKNILKDIKKFMMHPNVHSLILGLTTIYLIFGVMNAGLIMVSVLANIVDFFVNHSSTHGDVVLMGLGRIIFR